MAVCAVDAAVPVVAGAVSAAQEEVVALAAAAVAVVVRRVEGAVSAVPVVSLGAGAAVAAAVVATKVPPWRCGLERHRLSHTQSPIRLCTEASVSTEYGVITCLETGLAEPALWTGVWDCFLLSE